jgi:acetate kinase
VDLDGLRVRSLVVNAGSTSLKLSCVDAAERTTTYATLDDALADGGDVERVLHRVVHGGSRPAPALVDDSLLDELRGLVELAPLHQPAALDLIDRCRAALPDAPQYACFDTSFHTSVPAAARTYALPERWRSRVVAYGFHGISHSWSTRRVTEVAPDVRRLVIAHLGGGASLCAVRDKRSVMTTMGFTPLDGLVMATRPGALDPGAVLWMAEHGDEDLQHVFEHESGLVGLCGDADLRVVLERRAAGDAAATLAVDVYVHRLVTSIGACVAALEGIDALVFTGGAGEGSAVIRELAATRLGWLGVALTDRPPGGTVEEITGPGARVRTFVVEAREDLEMVRAVTTDDFASPGRSER